MAVSKKQIAFTTGELKTIRVLCQHKGCGAAMEFPVAATEAGRTGSHLGAPVCPACASPLGVQDVDGVHPLFRLVVALRTAVANEGLVKFEFVIPDDGR